MIFALDIFSDLFGAIIAGLPAIAIMAIPFIIGLIGGFLIKKSLKWGIVIGIIVVIAAFFGFFGLSLGSLAGLAATYSPIIYTYGILLLGVLPLGLGFIVGLILGFIFG